jgi:hypothetical protein
VLLSIEPLQPHSSLSITVFTKTTEMGLVIGRDFPTMLSLLKTKLKSD